MGDERPGLLRMFADATARRYGFVREEKAEADAKRIMALISNVAGSQFGTSLTSSDKTYSQLVDAYRSWVYTSIDKIAKSIATLKLKLYVYRAGGSRSKVILPSMVRAELKSMHTEAHRKRYLIQKNLRREEIDDHPFLELISKPNPVMTRFTLWYSTMVRLELAGSCPWYIPKNRMNLPGEIWPMPLTKSATMTPQVSPTADILAWIYRDGALRNEFPPEEVSFIRYPHPGSPFVGMSPLLAQTEPYDIDLYLSRRQRNIFENQAVVGLNLGTKEKLSKTEAEELKEFLDMQYSGVTRAGGNLITHSGLEAKQLSMSNRDAMLSDVATYSREKLITAYDLSDGKLGLVKDVNRANMEALNDTFVLDCLKPKTMLIEENIESDILPLYDEALTADFVLPDVEDKEYELKAMTERLGNLLSTVNEEREAQGKEPVPWGDAPWAPFNLVQIGAPPPAPTPPAKEVGDTSSVPFQEKEWDEPLKQITWQNFLGKTSHFEAVATGAIRKHFVQTRDAVLSRLRKYGPKHEGAYAGWSRRKVLADLAKRKGIDDININRNLEAARLRNVMRPIMVETVTASGKSMQRALGLDVNFNANDPTVMPWIGSRLEQFSNQVSGTTFDDIDTVLRAGFSEGKPMSVMADELRHTFDVADKYRAPLIARTEIAAGSNKADLLAIRASGVQSRLKKAWLSAQDGHVRDTHIAAESKYAAGGSPGPIAVNGVFKVGGDTMEAPGNGSLPEENINCRCTMIFVQKATGRPLGAPAPPRLPIPALPPPITVAPLAPPPGLMIGDDAYNAAFGRSLGKVAPLPESATTVEAIEKALYESTKDHPVLKQSVWDFKGYDMDPVVLRDTVTSWIELANEFPEAAANMKYFGGMNAEKLRLAAPMLEGYQDTFRRNPNWWAAAAPDFIGLNPRHYKQTQDVWTNIMKLSVNTGGSIPAAAGAPVASMVDHEFGHIMHNFLEHFSRQKDVFMNYSPTVNLPLSSEMSKRHEKLVNLWSGWKQYWSRNKKGLNDTVSSYAAYNHKEGFAEGFAEWWLKKQAGADMSVHAKKVGEIVEEAMEILRGMPGGTT